MPSYIGHTACAKELMSRLKLTSDERMRFIIGNMIPDIKQVDIDYSLDEFINKRNIQRSKRITHFRRKTNKILEFPNCDVFLEKYEKEIKKHIYQILILIYQKLIFFLLNLKIPLFNLRHRIHFNLISNQNLKHFLHLLLKCPKFHYIIKIKFLN